MVTVAGRRRATIEAECRPGLVDGQAIREFLRVQSLHQAEVDSRVALVTRPEKGWRNVVERGEGQFLVEAFPAEKREQLVFDDGAAGGNPVLVLQHSIPRLIVCLVLKRVCVQKRVFVAVACRPVKLVAATFCDGVHRAAAGSAVASVIGVDLDIDLLHGVSVRRSGPFARRVIVKAELAGDVGAIQGELIAAGDASTQAVGTVHIPTAVGIVVAGDLAAHGGSDQRIRLAAIDGHIFDLAAADDGAARACRGFQLGWLRVNDNRLLRPADFQLEVLVEGPRCKGRDLVLLHRLEALRFSGDGVAARDDVVDVIHALVGRFPGVGGTRVDVDGGDGCIGNDSAGGIGHLSGKGGARLLCLAGNCT